MCLTFIAAVSLIGKYIVIPIIAMLLLWLVFRGAR